MVSTVVWRAESARAPLSAARSDEAWGWARGSGSGWGSDSRLRLAWSLLRGSMSLQDGRPEVSNRRPSRSGAAIARPRLGRSLAAGPHRGPAAELSRLPAP